MFVEAAIEVQIKDNRLGQVDEHALKLWLHQGFQQTSCYRISKFKHANKQIQAEVALHFKPRSPEEVKQLEGGKPDQEILQGYIVRMFQARGVIRVLGPCRLVKQ